MGELQRSHKWGGEPWAPHPEAINVALAKPRFMDVDDHVDRYLLRCRELGKQPKSSEWLRWLLDDDAKAQERIAIATRRQQSLVDETTGTPLSWKQH